MGLFNALLGNVSEVDASALQEEYSKLFAYGEVVEKGYKLIRDVFMLTNKRLLLIDKQGITGKKVEYKSIPYKSIAGFAIETAGHFDLDAEMRIWVIGLNAALEVRFSKGVDIYQVQSILTNYIVK